MGFLLYISVISLSFFVVDVSSRSQPKSSKTTTFLDVTSSTLKTTSVFSLPDYYDKAALSALKEPPSVLSLSLHSRVSLHGTEGAMDYRSLTLARLERDSDRVESLSARLDLALGRTSGSDIEPDGFSDADLESGSVEAPIISGASQGSGEYFSRVGIGNPASQAYMVVDTGSDVSWVQCAPCSECYQQTDPIYDPATSSSFSRLACDAPRCRSLDLSECRNATCLYEVSYGDGSYTVGDFVTETLTLGSSAVPDVAIGCGHTNEGLFIGAAGLLGLGGGALSFPTQIGARSFSYCLVDRDSEAASTLEFDAPARPNAVTSGLRRNAEFETFYYVGLEGLSVGGRVLGNIPRRLFEVDGDGNGGIIIDSGTAVTRLRTEVYQALRDAFVNGTRHLDAVEGGVSLFDTCYDLSSMASVEVPTVSFVFRGGRELPLPAENFMIPVDSAGTYCFAFAPTTSHLSIIGNVQQQGTRVTLDLANSVVSFVPNDC